MGAHGGGEETGDRSGWAARCVPANKGTLASTLSRLQMEVKVCIHLTRKHRLETTNISSNVCTTFPSKVVPSDVTRAVAGNLIPTYHQSHASLWATTELPGFLKSRAAFSSMGGTRSS